MSENAPDAIFGTLSKVIASHMGLYYPRDRLRDLERSIAKAVPSLGYKDLQECTRRLLEAPLSEPQIEILAQHLTIGETHFFRHEKVFEVLEEQILPQLIDARRATSRRLRIWSAGCATGEEPYSLAMVIRRVVHDLAAWNVRILATDINRGFLRKAERGIYSQWSFRSVPPGIKETFFSEDEEGSEVADAIKAMVKFDCLNLARGAYPDAENDTHTMDMIFCRNVLMYFTPEKQQEVIDRLYRSLVDGGWLVVSPAEASVVMHPNLVAVNHPGVVMYRKDISHKGKTNFFAFALANPTFPSSSATERKFDFAPADSCLAAQDAPALESEALGAFPFFQPTTDPTPQIDPAPWMPPADDPITEVPAAPVEVFPPTEVAAEPEITPYVEALALYDQGRYAAAAEKLIQQLERNKSHEVKSGTAMALLARSYANLGKLDEALVWAAKTITTDKLNSDYHYLHGTILQEKGQVDAAVMSLRRAVFLEPNLVVAHFALGNIARQQGKPKDADRHYRIAMKILSDYDEQAPVPASEGMTAGRLMHMILAMTPKEIPNEKS
jgi:chemotaxis protein methyltransferase CheR